MIECAHGNSVILWLWVAIAETNHCDVAWTWTGHIHGLTYNCLIKRKAQGLTEIYDISGYDAVTISVA